MEVKLSRRRSRRIDVYVMMFGLIIVFLQQFTYSATFVVDGVSEWNNPTVQVGDSIIFRHKYNYNLYIFKNRRAFNLCNFTEATLLTPASPTFTWHPSRLGSFYFAFKNGSTKACDDGQKLAIQISSSSTLENPASPPLPQPPAAAPSASASGQGPPPSISIGGGIISSSPSYPWPNRPQELTTPTPSPMSAIFPINGAPTKGGSSLPFINSNPAVPLPTGEVDSATIGPLPTSSDHPLQVVGLVGFVRACCCVILLMVMV